MTNITLGDDIIDSRDIIELIEELEDDITDIDNDIEELQIEKDAAQSSLIHDELDAQTVIQIRFSIDTINTQIHTKEEARDQLKEELRPWKELADELSQYASDWDYGETLILDRYFTEYAEQLADDIGAIDREASWPVCHIDWEAAADALKIGYTYHEVDGHKYWVRAS